jgi:hypothetical protein
MSRTAVLSVDPCTLLSVRLNAVHAGICVRRTVYFLMVSDLYIVKTGNTLVSRSSKPGCFEFSWRNRTHAGGLVHKTYKSSISKNSAISCKVSCASSNQSWKDAPDGSTTISKAVPRVPLTYPRRVQMLARIIAGIPDV